MSHFEVKVTNGSGRGPTCVRGASAGRPGASAGEPGGKMLPLVTLKASEGINGINDLGSRSLFACGSDGHESSAH